MTFAHADAPTATRNGDRSRGRQKTAQTQQGEEDMTEKNNEQAAQPSEKPEGVLVRLSREELEQCKAETGVRMTATAVAAFVRKNLRGRQG